jgi:choline dehydrogenase-like flavoprotein
MLLRRKLDEKMANSPKCLFVGKILGNVVAECHDSRNGSAPSSTEILSLASFNFICVHSKTSHHCAGVCRMGRDDVTVIDPRLRFGGISGLRVAVASVMLTVHSSNTNAPPS